nr:MAG TPA: hypothetical protein [Caudoviricetes sp.]
MSYDTFFLFLGCLRNESFGYIIVINYSFRRGFYERF